MIIKAISEFVIPGLEGESEIESAQLAQLNSATFTPLNA